MEQPYFYKELFACKLVKLDFMPKHRIINVLFVILDVRHVLKILCLIVWLVEMILQILITQYNTISMYPKLFATFLVQMANLSKLDIQIYVLPVVQNVLNAKILQNNVVHFNVLLDIIIILLTVHVFWVVRLDIMEILLLIHAKFVSTDVLRALILRDLLAILAQQT